MVEDLVKNAFSDMAVLKNPQRTGFFFDLKLPSYMRDWIVMKFSDSDGEIDYDSVTNYMNKFVPTKEDYEQIKYNLQLGETVKMLARVNLKVNLKKNIVEFEILGFGGKSNDAAGVVTDEVLEKYADTLLKETENWGIIEFALGSTLDNNDENMELFTPPSNSFYKKLFGKDSDNNYTESSVRYKPNEIYLIGYKPFRPYRVDLDFYKNARNSFKVEEWIDVLISAVDYNPKGFVSFEQKLAFLQRLLPFVEKNLNLVELAPPGTGKSYLFGQISRFGWLVSGKSTRAQLIYNKTNKREGVIAYKDYVAFDEIREADYMKDTEMHSALQQIMENKQFKTDDGHIINVDAGIVFLGNIEENNMSVNKFMFEELPTPFHMTPFLDRLHGFIKGWELPRMNDDMKANGWALNSEYFSNILHELRNASMFRAIVDELLLLPPKSDTRDTEAIRRICTAYLKLLFPNVNNSKDVNPEDFDKYCLQPAKRMRAIIKNQMSILEGKGDNKQIPDIRVIGL